LNRPAIDNLNQDVQEYIITLETSLEEQKTRIADLEIMVQNMQRMLFGKKSEKMIPQVPAAVGEQMSLFNEAEEFADSAVPDPLEAEEIKVSAHKRKKNARKELFAKFPVLTQDYLLGTPARNCDECGREMDLIGKELVKEEYEFIPAHIEKHEFYRGVYRCKCCENGKPECFHCPFASEERCAVCRNRPRTIIKKAQLPLEYRYPFLKHSYASPSTVAQVIYAKYVQAIPLDRQVKDWERAEFPMSKATLCNWILEVDKYYGKVLVEYMHRELLKSHVLHCDETPVQVVREESSGKSHMWVFRSGEYEKKQIVIFDYQPSRKGECASRFLDGYRNYFVSDGYSGYNRAGDDGIRCGCWIHARRKFIEASPDKKMLTPCKAKTGFDFCEEILLEEKKLKSLDPDERKKLRNEKIKPIIDRFYLWCDQVDPRGVNKDFEKALTYARNQKEALCRFLEDGNIPAQNNRAENAIRPFVIGRKNWLFSQTAKGASASADMYSLVETAKANGLDVFDYLSWLFRQITAANHHFTDEFLEKLMPWSEQAQENC
jgi:transposase